MEWTRLMKMHWPTVAWLRDANDADDAAEEMRTAMGRGVAGNDELCATIRWMAGPEGKQEKAPSLRELIRATHIRRKAGGNNDRPQAAECAMCRGGWGGVAGEYGNPIAVPCMCSAGERIMEVAAEYQDMTSGQAAYIDGLRRRGVERARNAIRC